MQIELYWVGKFRKKWKRLGIYTQAADAYRTVDAIMSAYPSNKSLKFRITVQSVREITINNNH